MENRVIEHTEKPCCSLLARKQGFSGETVTGRDRVGLGLLLGCIAVIGCCFGFASYDIWGESLLKIANVLLSKPMNY